MFGIGVTEMIVILVIALLVVGPKKLPDMAKGLGKAMGEFKRATTELKETIEVETSIADVKKTLNEINVSVNETMKETTTSFSDTSVQKREAVLEYDLEEITTSFDDEVTVDVSDDVPDTAETERV